MADTLRYRAITRYTYGQALLALIAYARMHAGPDFTFGPLRLSALEQSGLVVSGPELAAVVDILARVPGLHQVPA